MSSADRHTSKEKSTQPERMDRHSATGQKDEHKLKKGGHGKGNWGTPGEFDDEDYEPTGTDNFSKEKEFSADVSVTLFHH